MAEVKDVPLLSRAELMELDVDQLVEKVLGLRNDIADDAEELAALRARLAQVTAERDAAVAAREALAGVVQSVATKLDAIRDREICEAERDVHLGVHAVVSGSQHYAAACVAIECADVVRGALTGTPVAMVRADDGACECGHPVEMHRGADRCGAWGCGCDRNAEEALVAALAAAGGV